MNVTLRRLSAAFVLGALVLSPIACAATGAAAPTPQPTQAAVSPTTQPTTIPLTGNVSRQALESYPGWESLRAQDYTPDPTAVEKIHSASASLELLAFLGTWCPDSKREVPRLLKLMDQAGIPELKLTVVGLDRTKMDAAGLTQKWKLLYVPTFIVLRDGKELGRVVEKSQGTLDGDLVQILASAQSFTLSGSRPEFRTVIATPMAAPQSSEPATITVQEVKALLDGPNKAPVFDARPRDRYDAGHVSGAVSLPLSELDQRLGDVPKDRLVVFLLRWQNLRGELRGGP